jgi:predicted component of type VI protein secretion system
MLSNFRLVMRSGPSVGKVYPLDKNEIFLGRDLNNDIVINDPEISRRHSRLFLQGNSYVLEDLGSTNGTFVNGQRLMGPHVLRPGDVVTFGERLSLVFESSDYDQDATMVSGAPRSPYGATQVPGDQEPFAPPAQPPAYSPPPYSPPANEQQAQRQPPPSFAGQVPAAYPADMPAQEKRGPAIWLIAIIILLLLCVCGALFLFFAPREFWCLFPIWPAGACP